MIGGKMIHYKVYSPEPSFQEERIAQLTRELDWYREYCSKLEQRIIDLHKLLEVALR
jgi:hypothetical protein